MATEIRQMVFRTRDVVTLTGLSRTTLWRMVKSGTFPKPVQACSQAVRLWRRADLEAWLDAPLP